MRIERPPWQRDFSPLLYSTHLHTTNSTKTHIPMGTGHRKYKRSLTKHLLNAAKSLIPPNWRTTNVPTDEKWMNSVEHLYSMESLTASLQGNSEKCALTWYPWCTYRGPPEETQSRKTVPEMHRQTPAHIGKSKTDQQDGTPNTERTALSPQQNLKNMKERSNPSTTEATLPTPPFFFFSFCIPPPLILPHFQLLPSPPQLGGQK
ncbi:Hypothetical predicted protein [Pelobates cultripes]|uniref:Uncharacterized protein n=1 Tax=Pelobates cultripes TaxID=61616 RepID=A0AAD1VVE9_PELCU|nr:Hypothetical predicted protein [Pelobates cultripes]